MYKLLGILTVAVFGVSITQAGTVVTTQPSVAAQPVGVTEKTHHPSFHRRKKQEMTSEQFNKEKEDKIAQAEKYRDTVKDLRDKVNKEDQEWFDAHLKCADIWIGALKGYQSPHTGIERAVSKLNKEISSARSLAALKPTPGKQKAKFVYPEKDIEKLEKRLNDVKPHVSKITGDNQVAFQAMVDCAELHLKCLKDAKGLPVNVHQILVHTMEYVNILEMFAHRREDNNSK